MPERVWAYWPRMVWLWPRRGKLPVGSWLRRGYVAFRVVHFAVIGFVLIVLSLFYFYSFDIFALNLITFTLPLTERMIYYKQ